MSDNYLVVGAGISGCTIANLISDNKDNRVTIIDISDHIAGNCFDYRDENGIMIHKYGSHIFHTTSEEVWAYISKFTSFKPYTHKVRAIIEGNEISIPFNFNSIYDSFPKKTAKNIEKKLLDKYKFGSRIPIMELMEQKDTDLSFLAQYVYDNVFVNYTSKQWGKHISELDEAVTARVPIILSHDNRYFQDRYQGIPSEGYTKMIQKMIDRPNIKVKLNTDFKECETKDYDKIFYTGPIDELMYYCLGDLPYRSERFEMEVVDHEYYQSCAVINYPNNYDFTRIHEYKYYLDDKSDRTVIAREYPEEFVVGKNKRYYPVPVHETRKMYEEYLKIAKEKYPNMHFLGRLGDYKYYDMDKAIARAMSVYKEVFY